MKMKLSLDQANNNDDLKALKEFLRQRIPLAVKMFKTIDKNETNLVNQDEFKHVINGFKLPARFIQEKVFEPIFIEFKDTDSEKIDYKKFIEHLADYKELNDFFNFKDKHIEKLKKKIEDSKESMIKSVALIKKEEEKKHILFEELEKNKRI